MTGRTFVLLQSSRNELNSVVRLITLLPGLEGVSRLKGPYDIVTRFSPGSTDAVATISVLPGVDRFVVCSSYVA